MLLRRLSRKWITLSSPPISSINCFRLASTSADQPTSSAVEVADPLLLYFSLVAQGKVKKDEEQLRALVQVISPRSIPRSPPFADRSLCTAQSMA